MLGIGGGILLVPVLVVGFGVPMARAVPASLCCVVASSCGAAARYVEHGLSDVRLALTLELATVAGAVTGGLVAGFFAPDLLALLFGVFALATAAQFAVGRKAREPDVHSYAPTNYPLGIGGSFVAGGVSALLGVGGGPIKVPLMNLLMGVPFKVASATSNLMIGVTAASSLAAYAWRGQLDLALVAPLVVGVLAGAQLGSSAMLKAPASRLRRLFGVVLLLIGAQMIWRGGHWLWTAVSR